MPSSYTENYNLSQWELTDKIQMSDFNADNAKIDAALAAETAARTAETAALSAAVARLGNCRVEVFSYAGTGKYGQDNPSRLTFSGVPSLFLIIGGRTFAMGIGGVSSGPLIINSDPYAHNSTMTYIWNGRTVDYYCTNSTAQMNSLNNIYHVVAFYAQDAQ